jgi:glycosyltransferase
MTAPRLTIVTAVRNGAETVAECLRSVRSQTVRPEHVVVDGRSADDTVAIVRRESPEARLLSEPDRGIYDAMNKGIAMASGEVVGILNADDRYPDARSLEPVARAFEDPAVRACYGDLVYVDGGRVVRYWKAGRYDEASFYRGWMPPHPTFFVRRELYGRYGGFDLSLGTAADYELMLRFLLRHGVRAVYVPGIRVEMRVGGASNESLARRLEANRMDRKAWRVNGLVPRPWTLLLKPLGKLPQYFVRPPKAIG